MRKIVVSRSKVLDYISQMYKSSSDEHFSVCVLVGSLIAVGDNLKTIVIDTIDEFKQINYKYTNE